MNKLKIATAQANFSVGDLQGNFEKISKLQKDASSKNADLLILSEMAITGYPPEDLVLRPDFQDKAIKIVHDLAALTKKDTAILVGGLWREGDKIYNAAFLLDNGKIEHVICKHDLPNYGVFDEKRVFATPPIPSPVEFRGVKLGIMICEDMWNLKTAPRLSKEGAEILISLNASPLETNKQNRRVQTATITVKDSKIPLIYVNQINGQDDLVFDGGSFIMEANTDIAFQQPFWREDIAFTNWKKKDDIWTCESKQKSELPDKMTNIYEALRLGLRDYVNKNGFPGVVIGMSGGIDSALTAAIATEALGKDKVRLVMLPSKYTSKESLDDAKECADLLGIKIESIPISESVTTLEQTLADTFSGKDPDLTEENMQSRIRGLILMAISNKFGHMVLTTGNKSEMAVGYATLYGDMCGGYNILKDIYKTEVFELAKWINKRKKAIPDNIISKPPSAELRPDQKDEDSLPPYDVLDDILIRLIEKRHSSKQIAEHGYPIELVEKVANLVRFSEYKRRQSPPGVKLTDLAFGRDRRYPITSSYAL